MIPYIAIAAFVVTTTTFLVAWVRARAQGAKLGVELEQAKAINEAQLQTLKERRQLDDLKDEFIATVSHELRTPLTSIRGALGLLSSGMLGKIDGKAQNLLRIASRNTDRLVRLINDILDLQRMDSGRSPLQVHRCSMPELEVQAVETMLPMAQIEQVSLEIVSTPDEASSFDGDPDRILQVLCNLLSNAIKFSPPGSVVKLHTSSTETDLYLRVEDSGRGIPPDNLESIFDRFQQVDPSDSRQKGGTGLGLAICRSIATQHGGAVWAERNDKDSPGRPGSTFTLRLPRLTLRDVPAPVPNSTAGAILVCDDDSGIRHIVAEQLRHHGYTVLEAESGESALHLAAHQRIDAILLDLYMPGLSGWETLERLKENPATADIPVVILSVLSPTARMRNDQLLSSSAHGWVQKPFHEQLLVTELARVLRHDEGPGRVLLVEDDDDLATVVLSSFEHSAGGALASLIVDRAATMEEAKLCCTRQPPDLLILDLGLPDGSGFALIAWMKDQALLRSLPVVVYSGREVSEGEMDQLRLGPTQFLSKTRVQPHNVEELVSAMVRHSRKPTTRIEQEAAANALPWNPS